MKSVIYKKYALEVLSTLVYPHPVRYSSIEKSTGLKPVPLTRALSSLVKEKFVEKELIDGNGTQYSITNRGIRARELLIELASL